MDAIALKALSPRIGDRYVDMAAFEQDLQRLLHSDFQGAGAPALSDCLRRLFPQESQASPGHPSLDDALAAGLNDLDAPPPDARTASVALPGPEPPHAQIEAPLTSLRSLRGPLLAAALGLWVGWLGMRPTGPARGTLSVDSDPAGAEVLVGGHAAGYTPWTGRSIPADTPVEIVVRSEGRRAWRREMRVPARGVAKIRATLEAHGAANHERDGNSGEQAPPPLMSWTERAWTLPRPAADAKSAGEHAAKRHTKKKRRAGKAATEQGTLSLRIQPYGVLVWKGRRHPSPVRGLSLPAGKHALHVEHPDWGVRRKVPVEILPGEETIERVRLRKPEETQ